MSSAGASMGKGSKMSRTPGLFPVSVSLLIWSSEDKVGRGFPPEAVRMSRTLAVGLSRSSLGFFEVEVSSSISFFLSISFLSISAAEFVHVLLWQRCWID